MMLELSSIRRVYPIVDVSEYPSSYLNNPGPISEVLCNDYGRAMIYVTYNVSFGK